jgi:predicted amidophosphoribosyltransferase
MKDGAPAPAEVVSGLASQVALMASGTLKKRTGVVVCAIPSKAGTAPRLERLLEAVEAECRRRGEMAHISFEPGVLGIKDGMASSHRLHLNKHDREVNAREHIFLRLPDAVAGRHVLLLDDVVTSGATMFYGRNRIVEGGALAVTCLALAKNVSARNNH